MASLFLATCFCNHLEEEEKAGCFAIIVLQIYCYYKCSVALPHGAVDGLQYVIVVFPHHTHLLFSVNTNIMKLE